MWIASTFIEQGHNENTLEDCCQTAVFPVFFQHSPWNWKHTAFTFTHGGCKDRCDHRCLAQQRLPSPFSPCKTTSQWSLSDPFASKLSKCSLREQPAPLWSAHDYFPICVRFQLEHKFCNTACPCPIAFGISLARYVDDQTNGNAPSSSCGSSWDGSPHGPTYRVPTRNE